MNLRYRIGINNNAVSVSGIFRVFFLMVSIISCKFDSSMYDQKEVKVNISNLTNEGFEIFNGSANSVCFTFGLNASLCYSEPEQLLSKIESLPDPLNFGFPYKTWSYLIKVISHSEPITTDEKLLSPLFYLNGFGSGFCDQQAVTFAGIMNLKGFKSRVCRLGGHYVAEVYYQGTWQMYDVDLKVFYLNKLGKISSVEELEKAPQLITQPYFKNTTAAKNSYAYEISEIYQTKENNMSHELKTCKNLNQTSSHFNIPPHSSLKYFNNQWVTLSSISDGKIDSVRYLTIEIEPGYNGNINFMLPVYKVIGNAVIKDENNELVPLSQDLISNSKNKLLTKLNIEKNNGIIFQLIVNKRLFSLKQGANNITLIGKPDINKLQITQVNSK